MSKTVQPQEVQQDQTMEDLENQALLAECEAAFSMGSLPLMDLVVSKQRNASSEERANAMIAGIEVIGELSQDALRTYFSYIENSLGKDEKKIHHDALLIVLNAVFATLITEAAESLSLFSEAAGVRVDMNVNATVTAREGSEPTGATKIPDAAGRPTLH